MRNATRIIAAAIAALFLASSLSLVAAPAMADDKPLPPPYTLEQCEADLSQERTSTTAARRESEDRMWQIAELERTVRNHETTIAHLGAVTDSLTRTLDRKQARIERLRAKLAAAQGR